MDLINLLLEFGGIVENQTELEKSQTEFNEKEKELFERQEKLIDSIKKEALEKRGGRLAPHEFAIIMHWYENSSSPWKVEVIKSYLARLQQIIKKTEDYNGKLFHLEYTTNLHTGEKVCISEKLRKIELVYDPENLGNDCTIHLYYTAGGPLEEKIARLPITIALDIVSGNNRGTILEIGTVVCPVCQGNPQPDGVGPICNGCKGSREVDIEKAENLKARMIMRR